MRVIMTGGGTGGHIYPAIAIADEIKRRHPDAEIIFVGTERGMERDIVPKAGYRIRFITVSGLKRKQIWKNVQTIRDLNKGFHEAKKIVEEFKPDFVIGTGGYVCGPVVRTAAKMGIRTFIHEQNAFPGVTNKLLSRSVERVFVAFDAAKSYFHTKEEPVTVGNPVRHAFSEVDRQQAREALGLKPTDIAVLSFGGSLGAKRINDEMIIAANRFAGHENCKIFFVTGRRYFNEITAASEDGAAPLPAAENITCLEYLDDMPKYLNACDLVISRSGALTVSEICVCGRASIMVPSPYVTGNHQYHNARVVADCGGAVLIEEKNLKEGQVADTIAELIEDPVRISGMEKAAAEIGVRDAALRICDLAGI